MAALTPTPTLPTSPKLWPAKAVAKHLGISYGALRDAYFRGELPVVRVGRAWYFVADDVNVWIDSHTTRVTAIEERRTRARAARRSAA